MAQALGMKGMVMVPTMIERIAWVFTRPEAYSNAIKQDRNSIRTREPGFMQGFPSAQQIQGGPMYLVLVGQYKPGSVSQGSK